MLYFVYETTNLSSGKIYVGAHATNIEDDGYLGSGKLLTQAIKKYGRENFKRKVLSYHETWDDALRAERVIVDEQFVLRDDTYNLKLGGEGSWFHRRGIKRTLEEKQKISDKLRGRAFSDEHKDRISQSHANVSGSNNPMFGRGPTKGSFSEKNHPFANSILIDGIRFSSVLQAAKSLNVTRHAIRKLINDGRAILVK